MLSNHSAAEMARNTNRKRDVALRKTPSTSSLMIKSLELAVLESQTSVKFYLFVVSLKSLLITTWS